MAIRNIREYGDEILTKKAREVEKIDERITTLIDDMIETMHKYNRSRPSCTTSWSIKTSNSNRHIRRRKRAGIVCVN